jgi:hypothetical protein
VVRVRKKPRVGIGTAEEGFAKHRTHCEHNLPATDCELFVGIETYEHFKPFKDGQPFLAVTDRQPLSALLMIEDPTNKLAHWLDRFNNFDVTIEYRGVKPNGIADGLSRLLDDSDLATSELMEYSSKLHFIHATNTTATEQKSENDCGSRNHNWWGRSTGRTAQTDELMSN